MRALEAYFATVHQLVQDFQNITVEKYDEQLLTETRGNLRIRIRFADSALLEISEALILKEEKLERLSYRYHYQDALAVLAFRYDDAPHHPEVPTHPHHKHERADLSKPSAVY